MNSIISIIFLFIISTISVEGKATAADCAGSGYAIKLKSFNLTPDPLPVPSIATFDITVELTEQLQHPIRIESEMKAKVFGISVGVDCPATGETKCIYNSWEEFCKTCTSTPTEKGIYPIQTTMQVTEKPPLGGTLEATINFISPSGQRGCVKISGIQFK